MWGTRQDNYCWPCKVFWDTRVAFANLRPEDSRIPDIPAIAAFVNTWHDWHRGYRIIRSADGVEEREILLGQPLREVEIGQLPRPNPAISMYHAQAVPWVLEHEPVSDLILEESDEVVNIPEEDRLFDSESEDHEVAAGAQESIYSRDQEAIQHIEGTEQRDPLLNMTTSQLREFADIIQRVNGMIRGLDWINSRLEPFAATVPHRPGANTGLAGLLQLQSRIQGVRSLLDDQADWINDSIALWQTQAGEAQSVRTQQNSLAHQQRRRQNYTTVFGTAEDVQRSDYISPISSMFNRHWERFRAAEEQRRHAQDGTNRTNGLQGQQTEDIGISRTPLRQVASVSNLRRNLDARSLQPRDMPTAETVLQTMQNAVHSMRLIDQRLAREDTIAPSDSLPSPPDEGLTEGQMYIKLQCRVCLEQVADIALVPCGLLSPNLILFAADDIRSPRNVPLVFSET